MIMTEKQEKQNRLAREILTLSRNTLLVNLRFLDVALSRLSWVPFENGTLMTDGEHILYDPCHVLSCYKSAKETPTRDYLHMVLHCVYRHMYMNPTLERTYWDLACDIAAEAVITELGIQATKAPREQHQAQYIAAVKRDLKHVTAEKIYAYLRQTVPNPTQVAKMRALFCADDHAIWYMTDDEARARFGLSSDPDQGDGDQGDSEQSGNDGGTSRMATADVWQDIARRMQVDLETFGKQRGLNHGAMTQNLAAVNREKYDYTAFLKKFAVMGETMKINDDEFDYIFYTYGLRLYEKMPLIEPLEYKEVKAIRDFVIAIDTSGELVQKFVQKTYNILKSTESFFTKINLHIIQCDTDIQEDAKITSREEFDEYLKTMQIRGLGGTDFRPVFRYVDRLRREGEFSNLKGLIYFTDGYGDFPAKKPEYETAFVFVDDECNNPNVPPWAIKLVLQSDEV